MILSCNASPSAYQDLMNHNGKMRSSVSLLKRIFHSVKWPLYFTKRHFIALG